MSATWSDGYATHRDALRRRVCAVCLETDAEGTCARLLPGECALRDRLPLVVETLGAVRSEAVRDAGAAAVELDG